jgi:drug/metabolite transporter (DMT)-like permease
MPAVFVLIWSTGFIVARYAMPHAPPMKFLMGRYVLSVLAFVAWITWSRVSWPGLRSQWLHLGLTGILMHGGYLGGVWMAVRHGMGSGLTALIVGVQPVLTAFWISSRGGTVSRRQWAGLLLGFTGLVLVVLRKLVESHEVTPFTLAMASMALLSITAGTLYQKAYVTPCDVRSANCIQLMAAGIVSLPFALAETDPVLWHSDLIGAMAWSVLGLTLGGSSLLFMLIQRGAAATVTSLMYLVPPTTAIMAWFLFGEPLSPLTLAGIALTAVGVGLVVRKPA